MPVYKDISLSFNKHPGTHDILKSYDVEAVKNSIKNIVLYSQYEKPFDPLFGVTIKGFLFEQNSPALIPVIKRKIQEQLYQYEPRAVIDDLIIKSTDDYSLYLEIQFHAIGFPRVSTVSIVVEKTR